MQHLLMPAVIALTLLLSSHGCALTPVFEQPVARVHAADLPSLRGQIDASLRGLEADGFSGAVMVARDGELVLSEGYGTADRERGLAATDRTLFQLASVSKQFTAAAIMKLEMEGKLRVSDPIGRYLDDVPADKRAITIHQLLTHLRPAAQGGRMLFHIGSTRA